MNRLPVALTALWLFRLTGAEPAAVLEAGVEPGGKTVRGMDCMECHTSATPTKEEPSLAPCPRSVSRQGPDVVLLDQLSSQYVPVIFAHRLHAQMTEINGGCALCHHFNPAHRILACRECHSPSIPESLAKPGLKGAYHRQCLNCHREWSHETECAVCHAKRTTEFVPVHLPDPTDIMGMLHPNAEEPKIKIYATAYQQGTLVTFRHEEHVKRYGFKCANCHQKENCSSCHDSDKQARSAKTLKQHHAPCAACHETGEEQTVACAGCHAERETPVFAHEKTGLALDETHRDAASCSDCHTSTGLNKYRAAVTCTGCHEEDEKISYPARIPGQKVTMR